MEYTPTVSFIIVNYNGEQLLEECFISLEKLNYPRNLLEFILIDNGSNDSSVEIMKNKFPYVKLLYNTNNEGFSKPNNDAAKIANGEILALINNDVVVTPNWLKEMISCLYLQEDRYACIGSTILDRDGNKIDFVGGSISFYGHGYQYDFGKNIEESENLHQEDKDILFACGGAMIVKKTIFILSGGFDEDYFAYYEDVDFGWRLWLLGYKVKLSSKSICYHKHNGTSLALDKEYKQSLLDKNSIFTIYKNYAENNVYKIILATLLLKLYVNKDKSYTTDYIFAFIKMLNKFSTKREYIQNNRKVSDKYIFSKFINSPYLNLISSVEESVYKEALECFAKAFKFDEVFNKPLE